MVLSVKQIVYFNNIDGTSRATFDGTSRATFVHIAQAKLCPASVGRMR